MKKRLLRFLLSEDGPTIVEYSVLLAFIVGSAILAITYVGFEIRDMSDVSVNALDSHLSD